MKLSYSFLLSIFVIASSQSIKANVIVITSEDQFNKEILSSGKPAVVKFGAVWCPACSRAEKPFHALAEQNSNVVFATVDADHNKGIVSKYNVSSLPTFLYFDNTGKVIATKTGFSENFKNEVTRTLGTLAAPTPEQKTATVEKKTEMIKPNVQVTQTETVKEVITPADEEQSALETEEGYACPAPTSPTVFERAYNSTRDFFTSVGNTIRSWFR